MNAKLEVKGFNGTRSNQYYVENYQEAEVLKYDIDGRGDYNMNSFKKLEPKSTVARTKQSTKNKNKRFATFLFEKFFFVG